MISDILVWIIGGALFVVGLTTIRDPWADHTLSARERDGLPPFARWIYGGNSRGENRFLGCAALFVGLPVFLIATVRLAMAALL